MASSVTLNNQSFAVGTIVVPIDSIPVGSVGFELALTRDSSWDSPLGHLFDFDVAISANAGASFDQWIHGNMEAGPMNDKFGNPATAASWTGKWPGDVDTNGSRKELKQTNVRITFNTTRAFTSPLVTLKAI